MGKLLVNELGLDREVDTLSRWMAHYLAEKITQAESLPTGVEKSCIEKECFSLVLELWKNRWELRHDLQPLRNFHHLLDILGRLDPRKKEPYYYHFNEKEAKEIKDASFDPSELDKLSVIALQIDKVARIWIDFVLRKAAINANNETIEKIVEQAVELPDSADTAIIRLVTSEDDIEIDGGRPFDAEKFDRKYRKEELSRRIAELEKFEKLNKYLKDEYKKELDALTRNSLKD